MRFIFNLSYAKRLFSKIYLFKMSELVQLTNKWSILASLRILSLKKITSRYSSFKDHLFTVAVVVFTTRKFIHSPLLRVYTPQRISNRCVDFEIDASLFIHLQHQLISSAETQTQAHGACASRVRLHTHTPTLHIFIISAQHC